MTSTMASLALSSRRLSNVLLYHCWTSSRRASEWASAGFIGSSMMRMSPPRPVSVPPVEVARRKPRFVVMNSVSAVLRGIEPGRRKRRLIPGRLHHGAAIAGVLAGELARVADADDAPGRVEAEKPGRQRHGRTDRLEVARRHEDDEALRPRPGRHARAHGRWPRGASSAGSPDPGRPFGTLSRRTRRSRASGRCGSTRSAAANSSGVKSSTVMAHYLRRRDSAAGKPGEPAGSLPSRARARRTMSRSSSLTVAAVASQLVGHLGAGDLDDLREGAYVAAHGLLEESEAHRPTTLDTV